MAIFTLEKRERFLALINTGATISSACADVNVSRPTVNKWVRAGQNEGAPVEKRDFSERFNLIRNGPDPDQGLSQADLIKLLEAKARKGHVLAMKLLLERPWEHVKPAEAEPEKPAGIFDQLSARRAARN